MANLVKCVGSLEDLTRSDPTSGTGTMNYEQFHATLKYLKSNLSEHEIITVARFYQDRRDEIMQKDTLVAIAQDQLRKAQFESFSFIEQQCEHYDQDR